MSDPFVAEIRIFTSYFAPKGWATCDGQLLPIAQFTALFSLLGTYYGGDGRSTFALPDLDGSTPIGAGQGAGLSQRFLGEIGGEPNVTLLQTEMPLHSHLFQGSTEPGALKAPSPTEFIARSKGGTIYQTVTNTNFVNMNFQELSVTGSSLPHNNMQPYLTLLYIIAMQGIFPPRG
jgi:microcystin-dependent protein